MSYSADIVIRAKAVLAQQRADAQSRYNQRLQEAYEKVPRLREIDKQLRLSMTLAAKTVFSEGGDPQAAMEEVKKANLLLQQERKALLEENFQPGYLEEETICSHCGGSGYLGSHMCGCLQSLCRQEQKKTLSQLTRGAERFEDFRLDYYPDTVDRTVGVSPRSLMEKTFRVARQFALEFTPGCGNLLFCGYTGLGKTFLSACIADVVADKGYGIVYESAPSLFAMLEKNRFNPSDITRAECEKYETCDLLIIDDLGTEMPGNFVTAALYALLNQRLLDGKSMLISTNLNNEEIAKRYSPQIASRLQGEFTNLPFLGQDIRVLKARGK